MDFNNVGRPDRILQISLGSAQALASSHPKCQDLILSTRNGVPVGDASFSLLLKGKQDFHDREI